MKTIVIAHNYTQSNFSAMSYELANYLAKNNYRVVFISHEPRFENPLFFEFEKGQLIVYSWPSKKRPTTLKDVVWFCKLYLEYKPSIVIGHFVGSNISILFSKILSFWKTKTYEYYHTLSSAIIEDLKETSIKQRFLFFRKKMFYTLFCDTIICPSAIAKEDLLHFYGIKNTTVILNPMLDRFKGFYNNNSQDKIIISYLGRFEPTKGVLDMIHAFKNYKNQYPHSKLILQIAGSGTQKAEIESVIKNETAIKYIGKLGYDVIDAFLNQSHYSIIPSKFDNLPTVGLESLMNGTPVLISNKTGLTSYLTEEYDCFKFEPNLEGIFKVFEKAETRFYINEQLKMNARITYENRFSIKEYCNAISNLVS